MNVIETASATRIAIAMPGPNACRKPRSATTSAAQAAATASPHVRMIGVSSAVVRCAAALGVSPASSRRRKRDKKNSE